MQIFDRYLATIHLNQLTMLFEAQLMGKSKLVLWDF